MQNVYLKEVEDALKKAGLGKKELNVYKGVALSDIGQMSPVVPLQQQEAPKIPEMQIQTVPSFDMPLATQQFTDENKQDDNPFKKQIDTLKSEITKYEKELANLGKDKIDFENSIKLAEKKKALADSQAKLQELLDKQQTIPIEEMKRYRDTGTVATKTDLQKATSQELQDTALQSLAMSRKVQAQAQVVEANIAQVNQYFNAKKELAEFNLKQKQKLLDAVIKQQGAYLTAKEKAKLERRKQIFDMYKLSAQAKYDLQKALMVKAVEKGINPNSILSGDLSSLNYEVAKKTDPVQLALNGKLDVYELSAKDQELFYKISEMRRKGKEADAENEIAKLTLRQTSSASIQTLENLLANEHGLRRAVGTVPFFGRNKFGLGTFNPEYNDFLADALNMYSTGTIKALIDMKKQGGTMGQLSEKELKVLQDALGALKPIRDSEGNPTGQFDMTEKKFKSTIKKLLASQYRAEILSAPNMTPEKYNMLNVYNMTLDELRALSNELKNANTVDAPMPADEFYKQIQGNVSAVDKIAESIAMRESGGNYKAIGKKTASGDMAYGKYQIMGVNIPDWSKEAIGRSVSINEFLNSPQIQDAVAKYKMKQYYDMYGTPEDVASLWFSGRPYRANVAMLKDVNGTTVNRYVNDVKKYYDA